MSTCFDEVCPCRAAFQYGIKMSEGRKTRRFKETNEKAELDRQWKKISAVSETACKQSKTSKQVHKQAGNSEVCVSLFQIIEKRKKMEADG